MNDRYDTVNDDATQARFLLVADGLEAQLRYRADSNILTLLHTEVPEALGGRGIAGALVRAAVERARRSNETIAPWCSYTRKWLGDHPDEVADITIDWSAPP